MPPKFADDRLQPGSEKLVEQVGDKLVREIVGTFFGKPTSLKSVHPQDQAPPPSESAGMPAPLSSPPGIALIDQMCASASEEQRVSRILELSKIVSQLQAARDAETFRLENEIKRKEEEISRLEAALKKAEAAPDFDDLQNALIDRFGPDDKSGKKSEKKKP